MKILRKIFSSPAGSGLTLLIGAIIVNIAVQGMGFFTMSNFNSILSINTPLIMAAIAQTIVVLTGGIDLSIGSTMTFVNTVAIVLANNHHLSITASWSLALIAGTLVGLLNGLVVGYIRIPPLLATFSTMSIVGGLALWVLPKPGGTVPSYVYTGYGSYFLGIPATVWIIAVVALIWGIICRYPIGRYMKAVGGREKSVYATGINTNRVKLFAYTLSGLITAAAGLCLTAVTASGDPKIGLPFGLNSIAAVILGGASLSGGVAAVSGSICGGLFLGLINNIVFFLFSKLSSVIPNFGSVSSFYQQLLSNLIVILGLASVVFTQRRKRRAALKRSQEGGKEHAV